MDLFVYGTLMVPSVMASVCGYRRSGIPALLRDYRCRRVRGEVYPAIIPWAGDEVNGLLYPAVSDRQTALLDAFEGDQYTREPVRLIVDGRLSRAEGYVLAAHARHRLSTAPWELQAFLRDGIDPFVAGYRGFHDLGPEG